jgi:hypothetical protein
VELLLKRVANGKNCTILIVFSAGIALIPGSSHNKKQGEEK